MLVCQHTSITILVMITSLISRRINGRNSFRWLFYCHFWGVLWAQTKATTSTTRTDCTWPNSDKYTSTTSTCNLTTSKWTPSEASSPTPTPKKTTKSTCVGAGTAGSNPSNWNSSKTTTQASSPCRLATTNTSTSSTACGAQIRKRRLLGGMVIICCHWRRRVGGGLSTIIWRGSGGAAQYWGISIRLSRRFTLLRRIILWKWPRRVRWRIGISML